MVNTHRITIESFPYFSAGTVHVVSCSCGRYRSGKQVYLGFAEKMGRDHVAAKLGAGFDIARFYREITYVSRDLAEGERAR